MKEAVLFILRGGAASWLWHTRVWEQLRLGKSDCRPETWQRRQGSREEGTGEPQRGGESGAETETGGTVRCAPVGHGFQFRIHGDSLLPKRRLTAIIVWLLSRIMRHWHQFKVWVEAEEWNSRTCGPTTGMSVTSTLTCTRSCAVQVSVSPYLCVFVCVYSSCQQGSCRVCAVHVYMLQRVSCEHVFMCVFEQFPFVHMPVTAVMLKVVSINHCSSERKGWSVCTSCV